MITHQLHIGQFSACGVAGKESRELRLLRLHTGYGDEAVLESRGEPLFGFDEWRGDDGGTGIRTGKGLARWLLPRH